jgi:hypothetical protein
MIAVKQVSNHPVYAIAVRVLERLTRGMNGGMHNEKHNPKRKEMLRL